MYSKILAAKSGDEQVLKELFLNYVPIVLRLQHKYFLRDFDVDDWYQEGFIVFYFAIHAFDEKNGASLGVFFKTSFENRILSLLRKQSAIKRKVDYESVSLEEKVEAEGPDCLLDHQNYITDPLTQIVIQETLAEAYQHLFSELEELVLTRYILGTEFTQIAQDTQLDIQTIRRAYDRGKRKLLKYLHKSK